MERIEPFHRLPARSDRAWWSVWTWRVLRIHLALVSLVLFAAAAGVWVYLYSLEFQRSHLDLLRLRIDRPAGIYSRSVQLELAGSVVLALAGLFLARTVHLLSQRRRSGLHWARWAALLPLAGIPAGLVLWWKAGSSSADAGVVAQVLSDLSLLVRLAAVLLLAQAALGLWYEIASFLPDMHALCNVTSDDGSPALRRVRRAVFVVWGLLAIGLGIGLAVLTDWLYELPVARPAPGELLYATTFDAFNDEWDLYPGRDAAQVTQASALGFLDDPTASPRGETLLITYGSGLSDEVVWSALDRKFNDMDLRVTARLASGPVDQNQFGVIFRYRDANNFYIFRISADGYYSLAKVKDGLQEKISDWGQTDAIRQGDASNDIRIVAQKDTFRFYVNEQPLPLCLKGDNKTSMWDPTGGPGACLTADLTDVYQDGSFTQGRVALAAGTIDGSDIAVAFDDLVILGPETAPDATSHE